MSIEKDIHQTKPFINEYLKAVVNIQYTHSWVVGHVKDLLNEFNITPQQYNILRILRGSKIPVSIGDIRQRMLDKMSDASRIVERLITKGLVTKAESAKDRRLVDIIISEKGKELLNEMDEITYRFNNVFSNLTQKEATTLNKLLDKFRASND